MRLATTAGKMPLISFIQSAATTIYGKDGDAENPIASLRQWIPAQRKGDGKQRQQRAGGDEEDTNFRRFVPHD